LILIRHIFRLQRLHLRLSYIVFLFLLLMSALLWSIAMIQQRSLLEADAEQFLAALVHLKAQELGEWVRGRRDDTRQMALNRLNQEAAYQLVSANLSVPEKNRFIGQLRENFRSYHQRQAEVIEVGLLDLSGEIFVTTQLPGGSIEFARDVVIDGVLTDSGNHFTLDIQLDPATGIRYMVFAEGLQTPGASETEVFAILYSVVSLRPHFDPLVDTVRDMGSTGEFVLLREVDGRVQILNPLRFNLNAAFSIVDIPPEEAASHPGILSATGSSGSMIRRDYRDEPVMVAYHHIPETGWGLIAKQDLAEIRAPLQTNFGMLLLPLFGGLLLTLLFTGLVNYELRAPLRRLQTILQNWRRHGWSERRQWPHSSVGEVQELIACDESLAAEWRAK
jgi:hypothetical protein